MAEPPIKGEHSTMTNGNGFSIGGLNDSEPPTPSSMRSLQQSMTSPNDVDSYFNPMGISRNNSVYSLSRASFSSQLSQLTALNLPQASSLSSNISSIPTASAATKALSNAAAQIQRWIQKASDVLGGLDAEDDVEWAAAGGREGLGEVDAAISKFEGLIGVYVSAIEALQERADVSKVSGPELKDVVDQMEKTLLDWAAIRKLLKGVKHQVELAMEWEELWNVVLGDIGLEMENLSRLIFEMEEKRHQALLGDSTNEAGVGLDIQELETIVEESPVGGATKSSHRFSIPPALPQNSPLQSPGMAPPQDDSNLLALFARMQPLRASLDFLPMRLSNFQIQGESILPTACQELETRRKTLEKKWKRLEGDAESLRRELGEDRWVLVFRNAGRQAQKMCESVERSIAKLQESIDLGAQHSNPPTLAKKVDNYEAKKTHYGPAIQRVLSIIEKGVNDRLTVNGEILRLHAEVQGRWAALEAEIKDMDLALEDLNTKKSQQLRDSISSIVSNDVSATNSVVDTPGSSPASSVVTGQSNGKKGDPFTSNLNNSSRSRGSSVTTSRPTNTKRHVSTPASSVVGAASHQIRTSQMARSVTSSNATSRNSSPYRGNSTPTLSTPTPNTRTARPPLNALEGRPRWNSSPKVEHYELGHSRFKLHSLASSPTTTTTTTASLAHRKSMTPLQTTPRNSCNISLPSPLGRDSSASPAPSTPRPRLALGRSSRATSSLGIRNPQSRRATSPSPARPLSDVYTPKSNMVASPRAASYSHLNSLNPPRGINQSRDSIVEEERDPLAKNATPPTSISKPTRPSTAMASGRRSSMLPVPKTRVSGIGINGGKGINGNK
ncbi:hypothetical protein MMC09_001550 [Bachmanniomyces sp. S44760]|nr:hypothetical protein [Bachmanniomyces sp. S44760]